MLTQTQLSKFKRQARLLARSSSLTHQQALERIAREQGYKSFQALSEAVNKATSQHYPQLVAQNDQRILSLREDLGGYREALAIGADNALEEVYAPFGYLERESRPAIVGLTPGDYQATVALRVYKAARETGLGRAPALKSAKKAASFSGPMRKNLIRILNHAGIPARIGIEDAALIFEADSDLCHFTSILRYPIFKGGENYSGTPKPARSDFLWKKVITRFLPEYLSLNDVIWVPLGAAVQDTFERLVQEKRISSENLILGLPHASGANMGRISKILHGDANASRVKASASYGNPQHQDSNQEGKTMHPKLTTRIKDRVVIGEVAEKALIEMAKKRGAVAKPINGPHSKTRAINLMRHGRER